MAYKQFELEGVGRVTVYKRKTSQSIRLTVTRTGEIKVTIPAWAPYNTGVSFARTRSSWIAEHKPTAQVLLQHGTAIGKAHRLLFIQEPGINTATTHIRGTEVRIRYPAALGINAEAVQIAARAACLRALRLQAKKLLRIRLEELAITHGYQYDSLAIKRLKGRWGSCDQHKNIILNLFLMQLPWHLIDYVVMHELAHTRVMQHGPIFWEEMEKYTPQARALRKQINQYQPILQ